MSERGAGARSVETASEAAVMDPSAPPDPHADAAERAAGRPAVMPERVDVLGFPVDVVDLQDAVRWVLDAVADGGKPRLVVTLNPEIVVQGLGDPDLAAALRSADLSVADGVGIALAARRAGHPLPGRVPGIDLVTELFHVGGPNVRAYFLGAKPGVAERAAAAAARRFGVTVAGHHHGYFDRVGESARICEGVRAARPDVLLAGLGEGQELFLDRHAQALGAKVLIGVGGTLDVLAGEVRRMPAWTTRLGVEWLFRVALDRRRWKRVPRLAKFLWLVVSQGRPGPAER